MPTILPEQYAVVLSKAAIARALGLGGGEAVAVRNVPGSYRSVGDGDDFLLRFAGAAPATVTVDVTPAGGTATAGHVLTVAGLDLARAAPADKSRGLDPARPFLLAVAGMIASAVAILVAAFAGIANKDAAPPYRDLLVEVMMWMAAVIVLATVAALLLQALRVGWMRSHSGDAPGSAGAWALSIAVCAIVCAVPVYYGYAAVQATVRGGIAALDWQEEQVPWALKPFR